MLHDAIWTMVLPATAPYYLAGRRLRFGYGGVSGASVIKCAGFPLE